MKYEGFQETIEGLAVAKSFDDVFVIMKEALARLNLNEWTYVFQIIESYTKSPAIGYVNYPKEWLARYLEKNYNDVDPIVRYYINNNLPLIWDARDDWSKLGDGVVSFMRDVLDFGFTGGLCVPLFSAQNTRGFINFVTRTPSLDHFRESLAGPVPSAVFLLRYVHEATLRIAMECGGNPYRNPLTPREKEILLWVGEGLTSKAIADQLGISRRTVECYFSEIQRKFNVSNRQQAVTKAVGLGFILPMNLYDTARDPLIKLIY